MKTPFDLNSFMTNNRTYIGNVRFYNDAVNSLASIIEPSEDVEFIAGTDVYQDNNGSQRCYAIVAITNNRLIYGPNGGFLQFGIDDFKSTGCQLVNNEGWVTIFFNNTIYVMFKTLPNLTDNTARLVNECLDPVAMEQKKERERLQQEAQMQAIERQRQLQAEHFEYEVRIINSPVNAATDLEKLQALIAEFTARSFKLHTITKNEVVGEGGEKLREEVYVFERKFK